MRFSTFRYHYYVIVKTLIYQLISYLNVLNDQCTFSENLAHLLGENTQLFNSTKPLDNIKTDCEIPLTSRLCNYCWQVTQA